MRLDDTRLEALEALVRWRHPRRGVLAPADFVPLAERSGLIVPLGAWVLAEACRQGAAWLARRPDLRMSVNVSVAQLADREFGGRLERVLRDSGLPAAHLTLELTETRAIDDLPAVVRCLADARALGVQIAVDDFGSGHASLEHLLELPVDVLKVPRTFVEELDGGGDGQIVGRGVVELARRLALTVVAEGVERPEQLERLRELGCPLGQGFLLARPLRAVDVEALLMQGAPAAIAA